jgi:fatty-acyl-CoA synthase
MYLTDLFKERIFTFSRLARLMMHVVRHGIQLANVVHMCADKDAVAIRHRDKSVTYRLLFRQVTSVSGYLYKTYRIKQGSDVLVIIDNSIPSVVLLLALSAIGCNIQVMAPIKDYDQFRRTVDPAKYDFVFSSIEEKFDYYNVVPLYFITPFWEEALSHEAYKPFVKVRTSLSIFTSGSTGVAKRAKRSNTLWQYLNAVSDLLITLRLQHYNSVILPVPIYHSYGLSALFLSLMLNKTLCIVNKFDAGEVAKEIATGRIEVAILIPQMLYRLLSYDLNSVRCIVSCSDVLPTTVFQAAKAKFGDIVFNLYGTSETGLATVATPEMLTLRPDTIGRPIHGCKLTLIMENGNPILYVKSGFAIKNGYVRTGDIATTDENGWYYLRGRADHLLVVNGLNVYPYELLQMVYKNEHVQHAEVKDFADEHGFRKIKLVLYCGQTHAMDENQFKNWWFKLYGTKFLPSTIEFKTNDSHIKLL